MKEENDVKERNGATIGLPELRFWHSDIEAVIVIILILLILGSINVFSSSFVMAERDHNTPYFFIQRHAISMVVGLIFGYIAYRLDYHKYSFLVPFLTIGLYIALISVLVFAPEINGARRWIAPFGISFLTFQPAEIAKLCCIIIMSNYLFVQIKRGKKPTILDGRNAVIFLLMAYLIYKEPDMGTAAIVIGIPLIMMLIVGLPMKEIYAVIIAAVGGSIVMVMQNTYRLERIKVWYDPFADALDKGYQTVRSLTAIGSGGFFGTGLGDGSSKYFYLPEAHTDFAFAVFSQENGFLMVLFVLALYTALSFYTLKIARSSKDVYGQLMAVGIMLLIVGQAIANMMMVSGVLPVIGVPLPFISYGGSSLIVSIVAVGILLNIAKQGEQARLDKVRKLKAEEKAARASRRRPLLKLVKN